MKIPFAIAALILAVAGIYAWNNHQRLALVRETHRDFVEEAAALGLAVKLEDSEGGRLATKRIRDNKDAEARELAARLIGFASGREGGDALEAAMRENGTELTKLMESLSAKQLKILIEELRTSTEMEEKDRMDMTIAALLVLANDQPEATLELLMRGDGLLPNRMANKRVLSKSLGKWAETDMEGALEWVGENAGKHFNLKADEVKLAMLKGAASSGFALSFDLIGKLQMKDSPEVAETLTEMVKNPADMTEFVKHYRGYLAGIQEGDDNFSRAAESVLSQAIAIEGFEEASRWIAENDLTASEQAKLAGSAALSADASEKAQWMEWMRKNLGEAHRDKSIALAMRQWTRSDYRAAGEWLVEAADGPAKHVSVAAYAKTVAPHDSEIAEQWAMTLPPGKLRENTLKAIKVHQSTD